VLDGESGEGDLGVGGRRGKADAGFSPRNCSIGHMHRENSTISVSIAYSPSPRRESASLYLPPHLHARLSFLERKNQDGTCPRRDSGHKMVQLQSLT